MRVKHWSSGKIEDKPIRSIIEYEISSTSSERGAIEDVEVRLAKLTEIVGRIAENLSPEHQKELVENFFYWRTK